MSESNKRPRKIFLVDRPMQLGLAVHGSTTIAVVAMVFLGGRAALPGSGDDGQGIGLASFLAFVFVLIGATSVATIVKTQKIAAPAHIIVQAIRGMRAGDSSRRLRLRTTDHLQELSEELELLRKELNRRVLLREKLLTEADNALTINDVQRARAVVNSLHELERSLVTPGRQRRNRTAAA